jgi:stringent starvation protein B
LLLEVSSKKDKNVLKRLLEMYTGISRRTFVFNERLFVWVVRDRWCAGIWLNEDVLLALLKKKLGINADGYLIKALTNFCVDNDYTIDLVKAVAEKLRGEGKILWAVATGNGVSEKDLEKLGMKKIGETEKKRQPVYMYVFEEKREEKPEPQQQVVQVVSARQSTAVVSSEKEENEEQKKKDRGEEMFKKEISEIDMFFRRTLPKRKG